MDGDGTQTGYDLEFTRAIVDAVDLPVAASVVQGISSIFMKGGERWRPDFIGGFRFPLSDLKHQGSQGIFKKEGTASQFITFREFFTTLQTIMISSSPCL